MSCSGLSVIALLWVIVLLCYEVFSCGQARNMLYLILDILNRDVIFFRLFVFLLIRSLLAWYRSEMLYQVSVLSRWVLMLLFSSLRLERLQRIVSKVQMESGVCEEQLNQLETLLQTVSLGPLTL